MRILFLLAKCGEIVMFLGQQYFAVLSGKMLDNHKRLWYFIHSR
jgi:hypothetical protein